MAFKITSSVKYENLNLDAVIEKTGPTNQALGLFAAASWYRLYYPFVPMQTGLLFQNVIVGSFSVTHTMPYARRQYHGNFNFRKDLHPLATKEWDQAATRAGKATTLANDIQTFINSGKAGI